MDPLSLGIGGALSLAGMAYSAIKGGQANRAQEKLLRKQEEENESWYNNRRNYMDTAEGKSAIEQVREAYEDRAKRDAQSAVVTGATGEAEIANKTEANRAYNDALRQIAAQGSTYARQNEGIYRQNLSSLANSRMQLNQQKAQNAGNLAQNAGNLLGTVAYSGVFGSSTGNTGPKLNERGRTAEQEDWLRKN